MAIFPHFSTQRCKDNKCGQSGPDTDRSVTAGSDIFIYGSMANLSFEYICVTLNVYFIRRGHLWIGELFSTLAYIMKIMEEAVSCSMFKNLLHIKLIYLKYFSTLHFTSLKSQMQALHFIEPSIFTAMYCTAVHCTSLHSTVSSFMQQDV